MTDAITYNDIYELLRSEKNSADLESIDAGYLARVKDYLAAKRKLLEAQKGGMFSGLKERAKILSEIENVRGALKDLFEKREYKVINRALYTLRTDLKMKDTTNMLPSEVELYNALLTILDKSKLAFLSLIDENVTEDKLPRVDAVSTPEIAPIVELAPSLSPPAASEVIDNPPPAEPAEEEVVLNNEELASSDDAQASQDISLTFLEAVPELVDANLNKHGPFREGQTASMPSELAIILMAQGKAKTA